MNVLTSWDDHRYFLAIARAGSLTAAAKTLSVSQPTVSRRLDAMETKLGVRLFRRTRRGYELTQNGAQLFETVVRVEEELLEADRNIVGRDSDMAGPLRFTTTENLLNGFLGHHIWAFLREHPDIELHLISTNSPLNLHRDEADLAVRFTEAPPQTMIGRRLGTAAYGIYGSANPSRELSTRDRSDWEWIGLETEIYNRLVFGTFLPNTRPKHRVDSLSAMHDMVRAALGAALLPCYTADRDPTLRRLDPDPFLNPKFDMWILFPPNQRRTRRLRSFAEFVADKIAAHTELFEGRCSAKMTM
jgi:DNA-binding transcriptional LysR family regulator